MLGEPRWHAGLAVAGAVALWTTLPDTFLPGAGVGDPARWIVVGLELLLFVPLLVSAPRRRAEESLLLQRAALVLPGIATLANGIALGFLVRVLLAGQGIGGTSLIRAAGAIWGTNVLVFGIWYWELDRGGPSQRASGGRQGPPDFLFPQMTDGAYRGWRPLFFDYLFVAFTTGTAFSPTDTMPLTRRAKALMTLQAGTSLLIVALVAARGVNILRS